MFPPIPQAAHLSLSLSLSLCPLKSAPWKLVQHINTIQPAYTKYESSTEDQQVVVIEVESVDHRNAVKNEFFIQLFQEELYWMVRKEYLLHLREEFKEADPANILDNLWPQSLLYDNSPPSWMKDFTDTDSTIPVAADSTIPVVIPILPEDSPTNDTT